MLGLLIAQTGQLATHHFLINGLSGRFEKMTIKEKIELLQTHKKALYRWAEAFWHLDEQELTPVQEPDPIIEVIPV